MSESFVEVDSRATIRHEIEEAAEHITLHIGRPDLIMQLSGEALTHLIEVGTQALTQLAAADTAPA